MRKNKNDNRDYIKDINVKIDVLNGLYDYRDVYIAKINIVKIIRFFRSPDWAIELIKKLFAYNFDI